jgi:hypothetical protein
MEDISSMEEEVSSMDDACSEAPSARDWLEEETWAAPELTCSAALLNPAITWFKGLLKRDATIIKLVTSTTMPARRVRIRAI